MKCRTAGQVTAQKLLRMCIPKILNGDLHLDLEWQNHRTVTVQIDTSSELTIFLFYFESYKLRRKNTTPRIPHEKKTIKLC